MRRITLTRFLIEEQRHKGVIQSDLRLLIEVVARACKETAPEELRLQVLGRLRAAHAGHQ